MFKKNKKQTETIKEPKEKKVRTDVYKRQALTWFMSQKTFDGKKPYCFLKSQITYALRPKITYVATHAFPLANDRSHGKTRTGHT